MRDVLFYCYECRYCIRYYCTLLTDNIEWRNACVYPFIDGFGSRNVNEVRNVCELR